ncbi:MAG TPA: CusA/CzcA family heavy metal efflux RND transporter [Rhizomicrobium sp.]|nr:CusA/CzcA family heavy metal efflux RND transporter [Rhizomicrobium sp.]
MVTQVISLAVRARWLVVFFTILLAAYGVHQALRLPIDATPDITNKQVQINFVAPTLGPEEIEKRLTFPIESALSGLAGVDSTRSFSRNGYGQVTVIFKESSDLYFMRQQVSERLAQAKANLPPDVEPRMGPVSTGLGEIIMYSVEYANPGGKGAPVRDGQPGWQSDGSYLTIDGERLTDEKAQLIYLRTVQDWILRPQLRTVPGVADIDSLGGYEKQYVVSPDPAKLVGYGISYSDVAKGLEAANLSVGANYIQRAGEAYLVHADARIHTIDEISRAVIAIRGGVPVTVRDIGTVRIGGDFRTGAASKNGREIAIGTALLLVGQNSRTVAGAVNDKLNEIKGNLPPGIVVNVILDRSQLVNATIHTVAENLAIGAFLVSVTLLLILGNFRAALIATLVIPLAVLIGAIGMNGLGVSGNLMSLGALDFGLIIDGAVIIVENSLRLLAERQHRNGGLLKQGERLEVVIQSSREMIGPTIFGQIVIFLVFVPCLSFQGVEGKMFSPMIVTLMLALAASFLLSLTFVPALTAILMSGRISEKEVLFIRKLKALYEPRLRYALRHPLAVIGGAAMVFALALLVFFSLGRVFIPQLDEINIDLAADRIASMSVDQSKRIDLLTEKALIKLPEVALVFSKTGTASLSFDAMPPNDSDNYVMLRPKDQWPDQSKDRVIEDIQRATAPLVGDSFEITQPIEMRFNELIAGVRSDVAVGVYGDDLASMARTARRIGAVMAKIPGAADLRVAQTQGFPSFDIRFDRDAISRYGLTMEDVTDAVSAALGGKQAGLVFTGDQRFPIVVRTTDAQRNDVDAIGLLPVMLPDKGDGHRSSVPLRQLVSFGVSDGLNEINRENGKRRILVETNVRGRDMGSFVDEAKSAIAQNVHLPAGYWLEWGGQFKNLEDAVGVLELIVPVCILLILATLYIALGDAVLALAVFTGVPLALAGGIFTIWLRGIPFSISAAVGFIAVSGVAVLNGLVLMSSIRHRIDGGEGPETAVAEGAMERLRPVVMTALVASLGFVPMAIATGTGAEVQRPLATVVIGGLLTSTFLTLFVLPAICQLVMRRWAVAGRWALDLHKGAKKPSGTSSSL